MTKYGVFLNRKRITLSFIFYVIPSYSYKFTVNFHISMTLFYLVLYGKSSTCLVVKFNSLQTFSLYN